MTGRIRRLLLLLLLRELLILGMLGGPVLCVCLIGLLLLLEKSWVLVEQIRVSGRIFGSVTLILLLADGVGICHEVVGRAIHLTQTKLSDELRVRHEALHPLVLLLS